MKVAILTPTFSHFSGIDRLVEGQAKRLTKEGHKVTIFTLKSEMKLSGVPIKVMGMPTSSFSERLYRLFMFLDRAKVKTFSKKIASYDKVIAHLYPMTILAHHAKRINNNLEYVYHNAGVGIVSTYSFSEKMYLKLFNWLNNRYVKSCDSSVSISDFLRKTLKRETGVEGVVEYIPVDKKRFNDKIDGTPIRKKFGIKKSDPVLLYVGRISPHKGLHLLLDVFQKVQNKFKSAKLIIVGKHTFGGYSKLLKKKANKDVVFAGFVPDKDLPQYYSACDVYTTASLWEGFDIPIVEAYESGKPSVAFDVGSHPEVLKKGALVKEGDIVGFAKEIVGILEKSFK